MSKLGHNLLEYPARWTGAAQGLVTAIFGLGAAFNWWTWSTDQWTAVTTVEGATFALVAAFGIHALVTPTVDLPEAGGDVVAPPPVAPYEPDIDPAAVAAVIPPPPGE